MPYFILKFSAPPEIVSSIQLNDSGLKFILSAKILDFDTSTAYMFDDYMEQITLAPLMFDKTPAPINERLLNEDSNKHSNQNQSVSFQCMCVPQYCLDINKMMVSGAYSNVNMTEALVALCSKLDIKTYITPLDNQNKYNQVILIPGNIITNIKFLQDTYGLYNNDIRLFMTENLLNIGTVNNDKAIDVGNIYIDVNFPVNNDSDNTVLGSYRDYTETTGIENVMINSKISFIRLSNTDELNTELYGNNNYYMSKKLTGGTSFEFRHDDKWSGNDPVYKTRSFDNNRNNENTLNAFQGQVNNSTLIDFTFSNLDIKYEDIFKPVYVDFHSTNYGEKYSGEYHITNMMLTYRITSSGATSQSGVLQMRKSFNDN